jgi:ribonuclease G
MSKELFVSSTPHETKVAIVEDDALAEIYFERENEYTLAGSIYKGRVNRVLPGMQSAFVDVGLERDAFLYVSDFFEDQEEFDAIAGQTEDDVTTKVVGRSSEPMAQAEPRREASGGAAPAGEGPGGNRDSQDGSRDQGSRRWRGRRRRGGRGRGPGSGPQDSQPPRPESARPDGQRPEAQRSESRRPEPRPQQPAARPQPPANYEPMVMPGESISKYRNRGISPAPMSPQPAREAAAPVETVIAEPAEARFIEPVAAAPLAEPPVSGRGSFEIVGGYDESAPAHPEAISHPPVAEAREVERLERMNLAATFAPEEAEEEAEGEEEREAAPPARGGLAAEAEVIEEELDEEEGDLPRREEELEDAELEEMMEEETLTPGGERFERGVEPGEQRPAGMSRGEAVAGEEMDFGEDEAEGEEEEAEGGEEEGSEAGPEAQAGEGTEAAEGGSPEHAEMRGPAGTLPRTAPAGRSERGRGRRGGRGGTGPRTRGRHNIQRGPRPQIADLLKEGQEILVQIAKEPMGKKGARITSHIALPGRFLVYMPTVDHIGVSRKIASDEERARLRRILLSERDTGTPEAPSTGKGGFIVRTAAAGANEDDLRADIRFLINLWSEIRGRADSSNAPALLYHDLNVVERILRDQVTETFSHIWVDSEAEYERVLRFVSRFQPSLVKRVKLYTKDTPLFEEFNIQEEINKALKSKVWLKSGGYIVINQTEALVAIDINTGKYVGKTARLEDTITRTNVDAIKEIVRQVRLRDLGGIIVIDFIDMDERRNRQKVMQALDEALRADRAPTKVLAFNDFGLVAITRKRVKQSLERTLGMQCTYCTGTGLIKSVATVCNEIYVEMRKIYKHLERQGDLMLRTHPEVAKNLKANGARLLGEMEELTGRTIIVKADPTLHQEQFDIQ